MIDLKLSVLTPQLTPIYSELTPKMRLEFCDCRQVPIAYAISYVKFSIYIHTYIVLNINLFR